MLVLRFFRVAGAVARLTSASPIGLVNNCLAADMGSMIAGVGLGEGAVLQAQGSEANPPGLTVSKSVQTSTNGGSALIERAPVVGVYCPTYPFTDTYCCPKGTQTLDNCVREGTYACDRNTNVGLCCDPMSPRESFDGAHNAVVGCSNDAAWWEGRGNGDYL